MRRILSITPIAAALAAGAVAAAPPVDAARFTQRDLMRGWCSNAGDQRCIAYIAGVRGALRQLDPARDRRIGRRLICGTAPDTDATRAGLVVYEISRHASWDQLAAADAVLRAMTVATPCRETDS